MAIILLFLASRLLYLFGAQFTDGYPLLFILVIGVVARASVGPAESLLNMAGKQKICAMVYAVTLIVNICLSILLIPAYGLAGAAFATAFSMVFEAVTLALTVYNRLNITMFVFAGRTRQACQGRNLMAAIPLLEELAGGPSSQIIAQLSGFDQSHDAAKQIEETLGNRGVPRKLSVYSASAGFELLDELEYLTYRTVEPNIFFNPRFLAPAMPRLDDRQVRFMVMRDENDVKSRLRFLMPYTIERPGFTVSASIIRAWATPFGPQGTPLIDRDDPVGVLNDLFDMLARKHLKFPEILVLARHAAEPHRWRS